MSRARALLLAWAAATAGAVGAFGASAAAIGVPAVFLLLFADGVIRPGSSVLYPTVRRGPRDGRRVALSFDDGPDPEVTPAVLDALAAHGAHAVPLILAGLRERGLECVTVSELLSPMP